MTKTAKRDYMRRARLDPIKHQRMIESQRRCYRNGGSDKQRERNKQMMKEDPFRWRALLLTSKFKRQVTKSELMGLWTGLCGLTGMELKIEDADIDHILPVSRGGTHEISNLRWVCSRANEAKGNMTDSELLLFCKQIAEWIGKKIIEAEVNHRGGRT